MSQITLVNLTDLHVGMVLPDLESLNMRSKIRRIDLQSASALDALVANSAFSIINVEQEDPRFAAGYLLAKQHKFLLIGDPRSPSCAGLDVLSVARGGVADEVMRRILGSVNFENPPDDTTDPHRFVAWVADKPSRIDRLSSDNLQKFVSHVILDLAEAYHTQILPERALPLLDVYRHKDRDVRFSVKCVSSALGERAGVGKLMSIASIGYSLENDFCIVCSQDEFTEAARRFAEVHSPALWLVDGEGLRSLAREWREVSGGGGRPESPKARGRESEPLAAQWVKLSTWHDEIAKLKPLHGVGDIEMACRRILATSLSDAAKPKIRVFVLFDSGSERRMASILAERLGELEKVEIYHSSVNLHFGQRVETEADILRTMRVCNLILGCYEHPVRSGDDLRVLQTAAFLVQRNRDLLPKTVWLTDGGMWSALSWPKVLLGATLAFGVADELVRGVIAAIEDATKRLRESIRISE